MPRLVVRLHASPVIEPWKRRVLMHFYGEEEEEETPGRATRLGMGPQTLAAVLPAITRRENCMRIQQAPPSCNASDTACAGGEGGVGGQGGGLLKEAHRRCDGLTGSAPLPHARKERCHVFSHIEQAVEFLEASANRTANALSLLSPATVTFPHRACDKTNNKNRSDRNLRNPTHGA